MDMNFLQRLGLLSPGVAPTDAYAPAPAADPMAAPTGGSPIVNAMQMGAPTNAAPPTAIQPARARSSIVDKLGQVADVFAKVGGANALYQPTLDARQDRQIALDDHAREVDLDKLKIESTQGTIGDANNVRLGQAVRGLQAITSANPNADISKVWPILARQAGVDPARADALGQQIAGNPELLKGLAGTVGASKEFGLAPFYAKGADGTLQAYQLSKDGSIQQVGLPDGAAPVDPLKFVDTGGAMAGVGSRSGNVTRILPKTERPGDAANRASREGIAANNNRTAITIAGMPARAAAPKAGGAGDDKAAGNSEALIALDNLENGFKDLHRMKALPGDDGGAAGNILSALGRTKLGQAVGEQAGSDAAQKRVEMGKTVNTLQQTLIKALPASATRTKFEQEILAKSLPDPSRMSLGTAQRVIGDYRAIFRRAQAAAASETKRTATPAAAPRAAPRTPAIRPRTGGAGKPSVSNW